MEPVFNTVSLISLAATAVLAVVAFIISKFLGKKCSQVDNLVLFWLVWDVMIHLTMEGPFVYFSLTGSVEKSQHWLAEPWKEYGKADKRWLISDPNIVSLEILTVVVDSLLCLILIYAIYKDRYYRHWVQIVLCVCEIYGGWMTFCPDWLVGSPNLVTDNMLYLWVYLIFFNGLWVIVPAALMYQSWADMKTAFSAVNKGLGARGSGDRGAGDRKSSSTQKKYNLRTKKTH